MDTIILYFVLRLGCRPLGISFHEKQIIVIMDLCQKLYDLIVQQLTIELISEVFGHSN